MTRTTRDLAQTDPWATSLERSRARGEAAGATRGRLVVSRRGASVVALVAVAGAPLVTAVADGGVLNPEAATARAQKPLKKGARGPRVVRLQRLLHLRADGVFGTATLRAVKRFQRRHHLTADGVAGPATLRALARANTPRKAAGHKPKVSRARARLVQRLLGLPVDGIFGPRTKRALKRFQAQHGLVVDGVPGPATLTALRRVHGSHHHMRAVHGTVRLLQRKLHITADGVFGPGTRRAVIRLQRRHGLTADGIVGPATWRALGVRSRTVLKMKHRAGRHTGRRGAIVRLVRAANRIARTPYRYGGGHGSFPDWGYDCSGSVSYALHGAGLLRSPLDSSSLMG